MEKTLGQVADENKGTELGDTLLRVNTRVTEETGKGVWNFQYKSVEQMGDAAGTFETRGQKLSMREDVPHDEKFAIHVGVHENLHKLGVVRCDGSSHCLMEGFTELKTTQLLGDQPVEAYKELVIGAQHVVDVVGDQAFELASQGKDSPILLKLAYIRAKLGVAANDDVEPLVEGVSSGDSIQNMASAMFVVPPHVNINAIAAEADRRIRATMPA